MSCIASVHDIKLWFCQRRRRRQRERQKSIGFHSWQNNNTARASRFFVHCILSLHDYDVKIPDVKFCGGREHKTTTFSLFSWTSMQSFRIQLQNKKSQHLTNWTRWNKRDKVWSRANSLFKWRFRNRRRGRCLSSLISRLYCAGNCWLRFSAGVWFRWVNKLSKMGRLLKFVGYVIHVSESQSIWCLACKQCSDMWLLMSPRPSLFPTQEDVHYSSLIFPRLSSIHSSPYLQTLKLKLLLVSPGRTQVVLFMSFDFISIVLLIVAEF